MLRAVPGAKWGLYQALSNPVRLYIGQQKANPSKPFLVPWWCPSFGERWHPSFLLSFDPHVASQDPRWRCTNQETLCFTQFGPWSFQSVKQLQSMGRWYILFDCIYIVGVKAKIALDKVKHSRKTIQGYGDATPELSLKLAPPKQKTLRVKWRSWAMIISLQWEVVLCLEARCPQTLGSYSPIGTKRWWCCVL